MYTEKQVAAALRILGETVWELGKTELRDLQKRVAQAVENAGSTEQLLKCAWNYEEYWCLQYTLEQAITWFKANMPRNARAACVYRRPRLDLIELQHCYLDDSNGPMLDGSCRHRVVTTNSLDKDFADQFQDQDVLVLK